MTGFIDQVIDLIQSPLLTILTMGIVVFLFSIVGAVFSVAYRELESRRVRWKKKVGRS